MPMKTPPHPGMHVRHDCLEPLRLSVTEGAKVLGVTRQALNIDTPSPRSWAEQTPRLSPGVPVGPG